MAPIDEMAIDRAPDLRPVWTTPLEWVLTVVNAVMFVVGFGGGLWWFWWMIRAIPTAAYGQAALIFLWSAFMMVVGGWYLWGTTIRWLRFYWRWRYASKVYVATWVKARIREFRNKNRAGLAYGWLFLSVFPLGYFLYVQIQYDLPAWSWLLWSLFVLWGPVQGRYLARIDRLSALVLTTEAPSSRSRFAPGRAASLGD